MISVSPNATMVSLVENMDVHEAHFGPSGASGDLRVVQQSVAN